MILLLLVPMRANALNLTAGKAAAATGGGITPGASYYLQNTDLLVPATFYVSSGTVQGQAVVIGSASFQGVITSTAGYVVAGSTADSIGFPSGVVGHPPIFFNSDVRNRCGIYSPVTHSISFASQGVQRVTIGASGGMTVNSGNFVASQVQSGTSITAPGLSNASGVSGINVSVIGNGRIDFINNLSALMTMRPEGIAMWSGGNLNSTNESQAPASVLIGTYSIRNLPLLIVSSPIPNNFPQFIVTGASVGVNVPFIVSAATTNAFGNSPSTYAVVIATSAPFDGANYSVAITSTGLFSFGGSSPTISSCGATPNGAMLRGTNMNGAVQIGGGAVTACTVNFFPPFIKTPICVVSGSLGTVTSFVSSLSNSQLVMGFSSSLGGGIGYFHCFGYNE